MSGTVCWVDTETTSLDAERGQIWEVALVGPRVPGSAIRAQPECEAVWHLPVDLSRADPISLGIGRFHERHHQGNANLAEKRPALTSASTFAHQFVGATHGLHLAGAVVSFDEERLRKLLLREGVIPSWHYHLVDVEALAAGKLGIEPPWDSEELSLAIGVRPEDFERHTALGDARWAKAVYEAVMFPPQPRGAG